MVITHRRSTKIISIAGGKGGVGKTELCANLGVRFGQLGFKTILIDLDLGGSNLHSTLGIKNKNSGLGNFISDRSLEFKNLVMPTPYENLYFIPGDVLVTGTSNLSFVQKQSIINHIEKLEADYVLLDLGSGSSNNVVDFFLISNSGIVITSPHVGSILNTYGFLKNTVFRFLIRAFSGASTIEKFLRSSIKERSPGNPVTITNVLANLDEKDSEFAQKARDCVNLIKPHVVLNMVRKEEDLNITEGLRDLVANHLDISLATLGMVLYDVNIAAAHKMKRPMVDVSHEGLFSIEIDRICQKIIQSPEFPKLALATELYPDSFALMRIESERDFQVFNKQQETKEQSAHANTEEFIEILSTQKKRIHELQKTVHMLTMKSSNT